MSPEAVTSGQLASLLSQDGYVAPSYTQKSLSTVLPAIAAALGYSEELEPVHGAGFHSAAQQSQADWGLHSNASTVFFVVDGLGYFNITEHAADAPFLAELNENCAHALAGFPSTTATSMSIIGTGQTAGSTGIVGYSAFDTVNGEHANFVSWKGLPDPLEFQRAPVILDSLARAGASVQSVGLPRYNGSGLTTAALRGPRYVEAHSLQDTLTAALSGARTHQLTHVYWAEIDKIGHHEGVGSTNWRAALRDFDFELRRFVEKCPAGTQIVLTADHGMINADPGQRVDLAQFSGLSKGLRGLGGEPRFTHAYFNSQGAANNAKATWEDAVGERGIVLTRDEIADSGLYGDVASHVYGWLGHLVIVAKERATIVDSQSMSPMALGLIGVHGSLTTTEMTIPGIALTV